LVKYLVTYSALNGVYLLFSILLLINQRMENENKVLLEAYENTVKSRYVKKKCRTLHQTIKFRMDLIFSFNVATINY